MWGPDQDMPDGPWWLLIRARTIAELDALIASVVVRDVASIGSHKLLLEVARAADFGVARSAAEPAPAEARVAVLDAFADYEEKCGNGRVWHWPGPRPRVLDDLNDPAARVVLSALHDLAKAGSAGLGEALAPVLEQRVA